MSSKEIVAYLVIMGTIFALVCGAIWLAVNKRSHHLDQATQAHQTQTTSSIAVRESTAQAQESTNNLMGENAETQAKRLVYAPKPEYPKLARQARIRGTVRMKVLIGTDGEVKHVEIISGHPMLTDAAVSAVSRWRYRPAVSDGQEKEVETEVDLTFDLDKE